MALDLYLQKDSNSPKSLDNHFLAFEDDGYFWFLYSPFFEEISAATGQAIDLYDGGFFEGRDLDLFSLTIADVRDALKEKPDLWEECTGTIVYQGEGKVEKLYSTVIKSRLEEILSTLETAVGEAKKQNLGILFYGD